MPYANNKGADQPAHPRSLINTFVVRSLDSIMPVVSISEISSFYLASVAEQAGLCLSWSQTPKTGFSRDEAHMFELLFVLSKSKTTCSLHTGFAFQNSQKGFVRTSETHF